MPSSILFLLLGAIDSGTHNCVPDQRKGEQGYPPVEFRQTRCHREQYEKHQADDCRDEKRGNVQVPTMTIDILFHSPKSPHSRLLVGEPLGGGAKIGRPTPRKSEIGVSPVA